ncbi:MAG TPA: glyceraldehyde 3-phosphate dehydrogenase NAD-binding domain-containing protein [Hyphomicrobiales bacterium]|nr:glyceraldehyde 3-phosphate dehydrogenase NAD-binding domain-containing protein [Hyphomicrobiales bacterium]
MTRVAINGLGRIGRSVLRASFERGDLEGFEIVALNELADLQTLAHLTRYDSTHGKFPGEVRSSGTNLLIDGRTLAVSHERDIRRLPWRELGVDMVLECTGAFTDRATGELHLQQGAGRVLFSQPAEPSVDATIVYGVNHTSLRPEHTIVSNASCTTNCIVPVIAALDAALGVQHGVITTIHSAMNDQPVIDAYHHTNLRKTRSAFQSIIPVDTGLARGIERILPHLADRFEAQALRVPTVNVSAIDLSVIVDQPVTPESVNQVLRDAAARSTPGVLACTDEPLASCDFNHDSRSAIIDLGQTRVAGRHLVKVLTWFDNEWGYANRMLDVARYWSLLQGSAE